MIEYINCGRALTIKVVASSYNGYDFLHVIYQEKELITTSPCGEWEVLQKSPR